MAKYLVIKPVQSGDGFMNDKNGNSVPMKSLVPKPSQIIEGKMQIRSVLGNNVSGVPYNIPTKVNGQLMVSTIMIPEENLELHEADKPVTPPIIEEVTGKNKADIILPDQNKEAAKKIEVENIEVDEASVFDLIGFLTS